MGNVFSAQQSVQTAPESTEIAAFAKIDAELLPDFSEICCSLVSAGSKQREIAISDQSDG